MKIPPSYHLSNEILELVSFIDSLRIYFNSNPISQNLKLNIQRKSILKSSLYSAKIEGNQLDEHTIPEKTLNNLNTKILNEQLEVFNILDGYEYIQNNDLKIDKDLILKLHQILMNKLSSDNGKIRHEQSAIFNQAGIAIYITPPPEKVMEYIEELVIFINSQKQFPLIVALVSHLIFEKIHPFLDGNGRVGRLLFQAILKNKNYFFPFCIPFEEYLNEHKSDYYYHLEKGLINTDEYLLFMLKAYLTQIEKIKKNLEIEINNKEKIYLPLRREEILNIVKDHGTVSFDFIKRRFLRVPERTLRYDLKKLIDSKLIVKIGTTNKVVYKII